MSAMLGGAGLERRFERLWEGYKGILGAAGQEPGCLGSGSLERVQSLAS